MRGATAELISLALVAGVIGLVCGYLIAAALLPDVAASLRGLYGAQIPGQLTLKPEWWTAGLFISVLGALAADIRADGLDTAEISWVGPVGFYASAGATVSRVFRLFARDL